MKRNNTGNKNTGDYNTGDRNTGDRNTGNSNTGDRNTGDFNTGDRNTGDFNTGNWNTGCFNTTTPTKMLIFEKKCTRKSWDKTIKPTFIYFTLLKDKTYQESFTSSFNNITDVEEIKLLLKLPNFNYTIFEKISGISKKMINDKLKELK